MKSVDDYIFSIKKDWQRETIADLLKIIKTNTSVNVKYTWYLLDLSAKDHFGWLGYENSTVYLSFSKGTLLDDPQELLRNSTKPPMKSLIFTKEDTIPVESIKALLKQAVKINQSEPTASFLEGALTVIRNEKAAESVRPKAMLPPVMTQALREQGVYDEFYKRPASQQIAYAIWIGAPIYNANRVKRLYKMTNDLKAGTFSPKNYQKN